MRSHSGIGKASLTLVSINSATLLPILACQTPASLRKVEFPPLDLLQKQIEDQVRTQSPAGDDEDPTGSARFFTGKREGCAWTQVESIHKWSFTLMKCINAFVYIEFLCCSYMFSFVFSCFASFIYAFMHLCIHGVMHECIHVLCFMHSCI